MMKHYWCRLIDAENCEVRFDDISKIIVIDRTRTNLDVIHGRYPIIIDWYGDPELYPSNLIYQRDTEPPTYYSFKELREHVEEWRKAQSKSLPNNTKPRGYHALGAQNAS
jgi:hypothetical protein